MRCFVSSAANPCISNTFPDAKKQSCGRWPVFPHNGHLCESSAEIASLKCLFEGTYTGALEITWTTSFPSTFSMGVSSSEFSFFELVLCAASAFRLHSIEHTSSSVASHTYWPHFPQITQNGPRMGADGASFDHSMTESHSESAEGEETSFKEPSSGDDASGEVVVGEISDCLDSPISAGASRGR